MEEKYYGNWKTLDSAGKKKSLKQKNPDGTIQNKEMEVFLS